ncbi:hypothetical protein Acsp01_25250 [Actinoplanes sp. NBRC 101535]|nr:hypothetical protein Acsp01_25250 [Actinoplanes sp. NBRC 101535]
MLDAAADATAIGDYDGLIAAIRSGDWVDGLLAGGSLGLSGLSVVLDPFSALFAGGLGWAMEYFAPLRTMLDDLTGSPESVVAQVSRWDEIGREMNDAAVELRSYLNGDLPDWEGDGATAYAGLMRHNIVAIDALGYTATAIGAITEAAGNLVRFTRDIVRDLIADLVARVVVWAAESLLVVTLPIVASQVAAAVATWAGRIATYAGALITSLTNLTRLVH